MKKSSLVSAIAATGIIGFGALGFYGHAQEQQTRQELASPAQVTRELYLLKATAEYGSQPDSALVGLLDQLIEEYPESARELGRENTPYADDVDESSVVAGKSDVDGTAQQIYQDLLEHGQDDARAASVGTVESLVAYEQQVNGSQGKVPDWLNQQKAAECFSSDSAGDAPESVKVLAESSDYYLYTAQVFDARSETDSLSESDRQATSSALKSSQQVEQQLSEAISCNWKLPANSPNFKIDSAQKPGKVLSEARDSYEINRDSVLNDSSVPVDSKLFKDLLVEKISSMKPAG